jgi:hypothetical protein
MLQMGQRPTKKNTGELEPILPEWLRDVRKQARESADEGELPASSTQPHIQKNEAPDLLAGLASQSNDDDDEIPDWLASINPVVKPKPSEPSTPEPIDDFFAQFNNKPAPEKPSEPPQEEAPSWIGGSAPSKPEQPAQKDELSAWLTSASQEPGESFSFEPGATQNVSDWTSKLGSSEPASQPAPEEKEDLSWLHDLEASAKQAETPSQPKQDAGWNFGAPPTPSSSQEDLSWLNNLGGTSAAQPSQGEDLSWLNALGGKAEPAQPAPSIPSQQEDLSWLDNLGGTPTPVEPSTSQPSQQEDLSWLNNLGATPEPAQPASSQEDLGWLNNLGGASEPAQSTSAAASSEDLSWLDSLGGVAEPAQETPTAQEDLGWLNNLGGVAEPAQPATTPSTPESDLDWLGKLGQASESEQPETTPSTSQDELDWLKNFAASTSEPSQPASTDSIELGWLDNLGSANEPPQTTPVEPATPRQEEPDWLSGLDKSSMPGYIPAKPFGTTEELNPPKTYDENSPSPVSPFVPRRTAPLSGATFNDDMPDWLKSATEETPNLPLGVSALEQFREKPHKPMEEKLPSAPEPDTIGSNLFSTSNASLSNQDVDSLFSMDMPDWLSKPQPEATDISSQKAETPVRDESLSPVDLPSWVQAMRPVESVLSETGPSIETQPTEKEGPLAGLRGVIPSAPIGSSRRPKAISLKLQATDEQQAGASLFDQILAGEIAPRVMEGISHVTSQNVLRWTISGILIVVLGAILFMRSQFMPVSPILPNDVTAATNAINAIPNDSSILVVVDYEPSLAGEMEAVGAPVLNQIILAHQPKLVLLTTSPESAGLIERLISNAHITLPSGSANLGYLPGGSAGILGFIAEPKHVIPSVTAQSFSEYSAVIVLTDHAESGRAWVEQLDIAKQSDPSLANQSVILVTSAQAGPLLQPYVSSKQAAGMVNGLADAARFEYANAIPSTNWIARNYWDAFGFGILLAIVFIIIGSVWSLVSGLRARRASGEQG